MMVFSIYHVQIADLLSVVVLLDKEKICPGGAIRSEKDGKFIK